MRKCLNLLEKINLDIRKKAHFISTAVENGACQKFMLKKLKFPVVQFIVKKHSCENKEMRKNNLVCQISWENVKQEEEGMDKGIKGKFPLIFSLHLYVDAIFSDPVTYENLL